MIVERTVSRWREDRWESLGEKLSDFRSAHAYVLLGEPGSGKSTAFEDEAEHHGIGPPVTAGRFIGRHLDSHPEWRNKTLFIDGLDEVRAGGGDPREPLNELLSRIEQLGQPPFRLSCRDESWLEPNDLRELSSVTNGHELHPLRLDPLTREDARRILLAAGVGDPDDFMWQAIDRGLDVFLQNPLLLNVLARAVSSGSWPVGQLDAFERACKELVMESSQTHLDAWDGPHFANDEVVLAAGRLCAVLLLSGKSGWSRRGPGDEDHPALSEAGERQRLLKWALDTKLFEGSVETGRTPRHRRIAEFLAASYLDHAIRRERVSASRVLALMKGADGVVMPDLRGVSVWLAARNPEVRGPLIDADPIGVAFYGDAGGFSRRDTALLLRGLETRLDHEWDWPSSASLGAMMAGPAREMLWEMLQSTDRSGARQMLVELLLRGVAVTPLGGVLAEARRSAGKTDRANGVLLAVVRDPGWRPTVRHQALITLIHLLEDEAEGPEILFELLRYMNEGNVPEDERGELRGELLTNLYPRHLTADHIWVHLPSGTVPQGQGKRFWTRHLVDESSPEDVTTLLDTLAARAKELIFLLAQHDVESLVLRLLARGLELFGERMEVAEFYDWFELVEPDYGRTGLVPAHCREVVLRGRHLEEQEKIYSWLRNHREIQLALVLEGLQRNASIPRKTALDHTIGVKFLGDETPLGFRGWCLDKAVELAATARTVSIELAIWAVTRREEWGPPLRDDEVAAGVRRAPLLQDWNERRVAAEAQQAVKHAQRLESPPYTRVRERRAAYVASVRERLETLEAGEGPLPTLHELGRVYVNGLEAGGPKKARMELELHLGSDQDLCEAVIRGFRRVVGRTDLPGLDDIIGLREEHQMSYYALPFLAGLAEDERAGADPLERVDPEGLRRALGFYLLSRLPTKYHPIPGLYNHWKDCRPRWYVHALQAHPEAVADAMVAVHRARVRTKASPDQHLYDMVATEEYARVAALALPRMFTPFPSRCAGEAQLAALRQVLLAAIKYMAPDELRQLVQTRLARRKMDGGQRAQWLAAGMFVAPSECVPKLIDFVSGEGEQGVHQLLDFLVPDADRRPLPNQEWPTAHLASLIKAVGKRLYPPWDDRRGSSDQFMAGEGFATGLKAEPLLSTWVKTLADRIDEEAIAALASLADDPALTKWRRMLLRARHQQAEKHRLSAYRAPTVSQIQEALRDGTPASAADLQALLTDKLAKLADRIRNGNTDDWQQYWHTDSEDRKGRRVTKPKTEDPCRDALLSDLQLLLEPHGVDAGPEGHHAEDARSDIIAVSGVHAVLVEAKRTESGKLWSAISDQLIAKYLRDPRSGGYGIYLVFWFGPEYLRVSPPAGTRPRSPEELRDMLDGLVPPEERRTIAVVVVDVSAPADRLAG